MSSTQPMEVSDFTGGITDNVLDGHINEAAVLDNLQYKENGKLTTRWGAETFLEKQVFSGNHRISAMHHVRDPLRIKDTLIAISNGAINLPKEDLTGWEYLLGPSRGSAFDSYTEDSIYAIADYQDHVFIANDSFCSIQKVYYDETSALKLRNAGLPHIPSTVNITITPPTGTDHTYSYAFLFRYEYKVGDTSYLDRGPIYFYPEIVEGGEIDAGNGSTITLPTQSLVDPGNWDVSNFKVEIYRTPNGSPNYFLVDTVDYGTSSVTDEVNDETLQGNAPLYGNNGAISNDPPPKAKVLTIVNNTGYYAHVKNGDDNIDKYIVYQSILGDPDSVPNNFFTHAEQAIVSVSSIYDRPMLLCGSGYIYRVDGNIRSDGSGNMDLVRLDDRAGCVAHNSVVQTSQGLVWAGLNGFYWSDGFKVKKISGGFNESYKNIVSNPIAASRIQGTYDPSSERVYWSVSYNNTVDDEVNAMFVLDLRFRTKHGSAFTTFSGGDSFAPTSVLFHKDPNTSVTTLYRGDSRGFVLYHQEGMFSDPDITLGLTTPDEWNTNAIIYDYTSTFMDFGTKYVRKFVPRILVSADNVTNLTMAILSNNDKGKVRGELRQISYQDNVIWGNPLPAWGTQNIIWNKEGIIEQWRRFPAGGLRCQYKQVQFTNGVTNIVTSDLLGEATIDPILKKAILLDGKEFPPDMGNYYISFDDDEYEKQYLVISTDGAELVFSDPENKQVLSIHRKFKIRGIPKDEILVLNAYVLHYAPLSKTQDHYVNPSFATTGGD
jgi:hypothetical protein